MRNCMDYNLKKARQSRNKVLTQGKDAVECALLSTLPQVEGPQEAAVL